jgi:hypothetical protein
MCSWPSIRIHAPLAFTSSALLAAAACGPALRAQSDEPQTAESARPAPEETAAAPDANAAAEDDARRKARAWLALVDRGQYSESWDTAAALFQSSTTKEQWSAAAQRVREPLGRLSARRFRAAEFRTALTGAPEGKYFIVHYDSAFAKKPSTREVLTLKQAPDASWKVAGYFVD